MAQRDSRSCCLSSRPLRGRMSLATEKPIRDRKVEAEEMPAAVIPVSMVMPIMGGSTFMAAQIRARLPTSSPLMLRIKAAVKYREMVTAITPMEDQMEERITTCSSLAIR